MFGDIVATSDTTLTVGLFGFLTILLLVFGIFMWLAGAFTAYFGSGKSRMIGVVLVVVGVVVDIVAAIWYHYSVTPHLGSLILGTFLVLLAAAIGALIAVAIFLVAIMKS